MSETIDLTYELMKRLHAEFGEFRRDLVSLKMRLSSVEQHQATMAIDVARINAELDEIRGDVSLIKRRLDLVDA
jgi:predicted  nucleic acid-binding Zn-ribbon protein